MWLFTRILAIVFITQSLYAHTGLYNQAPDDPLSSLETDSSLFRDQFHSAYDTIDEVSSLLQHIVQIVNKGVFKVPFKQKAKNWASAHIKIAYSFRWIDGASSTQALYKLLVATECLINHIIREVRNNLTYLTLFQIPTISEKELSDKEDKLSDLIEELLHTNKALLADLENTIRTLGLSWINILTRKIDSFDSHYGITRALEQLPRFAGLGGLALYALPEHSVDHIPLIRALKKYIGSPEPAQGIEGSSAPQRKLTLASFLRGPDAKIIQFLVPLAFSMLSKDFFNGAIMPIKQLLRPFWNSLRGFEVPYSSRYKYKYPGITLDDPRLIGLTSQIEEMKKIVRYIVDPETFDRANCSIEKGILLEGPSRTGKTLLANALCGTINEQLTKRGIYKQFAFRKVKALEIYQSPNGIRGLIQEAKDNAPCILFIDELHTLNLQTKEGVGEILAQFLTMAEELHSNDIGDAVILLGATNRAHLLDDALLKPERFGNIIHFENPTAAMRNRYFTEMFAYNALDPLLFDIDLLVRQTEGCSYGDLDLIFKSARFSARTKAKTVCQSDFEEKIYQYIYRINESTTHSLTAQEKRIIAIHIAGQALLHVLYQEDLHEKLEIATIKGIWPKIEETRYFDIEAIKAAKQKNKIQFGSIFTSHDSERLLIPKDPEAVCKIALGGIIAQDLLLGTICYSYRPTEKSTAFSILQEALYKGLTPQQFTDREKQQLLIKAREWMEHCEQDARRCLTDYKGYVEKIALELETKELITFKDIRRLLQEPLEINECKNKAYSPLT